MNDKLPINSKCFYSYEIVLLNTQDELAFSRKKRLNECRMIVQVLCPGCMSYYHVKFSFQSKRYEILLVEFIPIVNFQTLFCVET